MKSNNLNLSNCSHNEFMSEDQNNTPQLSIQQQGIDQMSRMMVLLKKMSSDPALLMKMLQTAKNSERSPEQRKRQFQVEQYKYRNHQLSPRRKQAEQTSIPLKEERKKGTDVIRGSLPQQKDIIMEKYLPNSKIQNQNMDNFNNLVTNPSEYYPQNANKTNSNHTKQKLYESNNESQTINKYIQDQRPIKPAKGYAYQADLNQSQIFNNSSLLPPDPNKYKESQERPIKGIQGDFKNYLMTQQGFPISQHPANEDENIQQSNQENQKTKTFLKRGSRQFLSSAKDRSIPKPKLTNQGSLKQDLNASIIKNKDNERPQRSVSQNRVLGRKSVSSKSFTKRNTKPQKEKQQIQTLQYSNTLANHAINEDISSKKTKQRYNRQKSTSPTFKQQNSPKLYKNKKKNIFCQSSEQEKQIASRNSVSEAQREESGNFINVNKSQIIPGVFLTKKELHKILTKFHKASALQKSNEDQQKIQQLKNKYIDLCNVLAEEKQIFEQQIQKQRQQFEIYKQTQMAKIKNQRKVQQRNIMNNQKNKDKEKQREEYETLKRVLEKERQQYKHKQKNYKIMIQKYKKMVEQKDKHLPIQQTKNDGRTLQTSQPNNRKKQKSVKANEQTFQQQQSISKSNFKEEQNLQKKQNKKDNNLVINAASNRQNKQSQWDRLPNYNDLKKPTTSKPPQSKSNKNKQFEYFQQMNSKQTVKDWNKCNNIQDNVEEPQDNSDQENQSDRQEVVQYNSSMKLADLTKIPLNIKMVTDQMIEQLFRYQNNPQYRKYLEIVRGKPRTKIHTSRNATQRKTTNIYADGGKEVIFDTGVRKEYFNNGYVIIFFANGDIKQKLPDQTVLYFYKQKQVDQITLTNKINIYRFDNNQVEFHFEDKTVQIRHPDGTFKVI